jgi:hypothetical protein
VNVAVATAVLGDSASQRNATEGFGAGTPCALAPAAPRPANTSAMSANDRPEILCCNVIDHSFAATSIERRRPKNRRFIRTTVF